MLLPRSTHADAGSAIRRADHAHAPHSRDGTVGIRSVEPARFREMPSRWRCSRTHRPKASGSGAAPNRPAANRPTGRRSSLLVRITVASEATISKFSGACTKGCSKWASFAGEGVGNVPRTSLMSITLDAVEAGPASTRRWLGLQTVARFWPPGPDLLEVAQLDELSSRGPYRHVVQVGLLSN